MTKWVLLCGKKYIPVLTRSGKLDMRAMVAYGPRDKGVFILSVYILVHSAGFGKRGGTVPDNKDVLLYREYVPYATSEEEQERKLEVALLLWATQLENDYALRLPIAPKKTPKYSKQTEGKGKWLTKT